MTTMSRTVLWVSSALYGAVLVAGLYAGLAGLGETRPALFVGGIAALLALQVYEWRRYPAGTARRAALMLLVARTVLFVVVASADGSGLSRVLFVLIPFAAYFAFGRAASLTLCAVCVTLVVVALQWGDPGWHTDVKQVSDLLMFCVGMVLAVAMAAVAAEEQRGRARLEESHRQLRAYATRVRELSATAERNRLARDIHDSLGHHLTAIAVLLEKAGAFRDRDPAVAQQALDEAHRCARRALDDVRQSVRSLRAESAPPDLATALGDLARQLDDGSLAVTVDLAGDQDGYDTATLTTLYRAAQEGLTNTIRHADASRVSVRVVLDGSGATLVVDDDGRGFSPDQEVGFGLLGMRERVQLVGGRVEVASAPDAGTRLTVTIPHPA